MGRIIEFPFEDRYVPLAQNSLFQDENCFSIIIGRNGTGKSRLLSDIVSNYSKMIDEKNNYFFGANGFIPAKILAVSTSPFDKFPSVPRSKTTSFRSIYSYIGMRSSGMYATNAMALMSSTTKGLINKYLESERHENLNEIFRLLKIEAKLSFVFKLNINRKIAIKDPNNPEQKYFVDYEDVGISLTDRRGNAIDDSFEEILEDRIFESFRSLSQEVKNDIAYALNYTMERLDTKRDSLFKLDFDYISKYREGFIDKHFATAVLTLLNHNIVKLFDLKIWKKHESGDTQELSLRRASSGEQCMLVMTLGIAGQIEHRSLILIDEPEISLHPAWQERFIKTLTTVFSQYKECHFIIATHSPQIISRLSTENCFITVIDENKLHRANDYLEKSADFQLAELFDAPGIMNEYITRLAFSLLTKVRSERTLTDQAKAEMKKLQTMQGKLEETDPNFELINTVVDVCQYYATN
ncbi:AAA family ATPase [Pseudomonas benzopyrenica]|uniref:AAA family ATPase n=1 Tax=Pseudomonas benzopyrenica TaxID=2993566 RepID=A0ABZ2FXB1_9PSED